MEHVITGMGMWQNAADITTDDFATAIMDKLLLLCPSATHFKAMELLHHTGRIGANIGNDMSKCSGDSDCIQRFLHKICNM
jgi:hypothetical protein